MPILTSAESDCVPQSREAPLGNETALQEVEVVAPGYVPVLDAKPLSKSVKRNRKKKEKRLQLCKEMALVVVVPVLESAKKNTEKKEKRLQGKGWKSGVLSSAEDVNVAKEPVGVDELVASHIKELSISANPSAVVTLAPSSTESSAPRGLSSDDKRLRALKKKIRSLKKHSLLNEEQFSRLESLYRELISLKLILELRKEAKS